MARRPGRSVKPYIPDHIHDPDLYVHVHGVKTSQPYNRSTRVSSRAKLYIRSACPEQSIDQETGGNFQTVFNSLNSFSGTTNPHWKQQVANGDNALTPASGTRINFEHKWLSSELSVWDNVNHVHRLVEIYGYPVVSPGSPAAVTTNQKTAVDDRAKAKLLNRIDSVLSSVELGQDLGEYRETIHGVTSPLQSLRHHLLSYFDSVTKLKRSLKRNPVGLIKAVADTYLEFNFGWLPIARDVVDGVLAMKNRSNHFRLTPLKASSKEHCSHHETGEGSISNDPFGFITVLQRSSSQRTYKVRYKGMVKTDLAGPVPWNTVMQIDLPHFIPTVWDLIPYSFVVDYFTNVGDIVRGYCTRTNNVAWLNRTNREVMHSDMLTYTRRAPGFFASIYSILGERHDTSHSTYDETTFSRFAVDPSAYLGQSSVHINMPDIISKPWLNIAAILSGRINKLVPLTRR